MDDTAYLQCYSLDAMQAAAPVPTVGPRFSRSTRSGGDGWSVNTVTTKMATPRGLIPATHFARRSPAFGQSLPNVTPIFTTIAWGTLVA